MHFKICSIKMTGYIVVLIFRWIHKIKLTIVLKHAKPYLLHYYSLLVFYVTSTQTGSERLVT